MSIDRVESLFRTVSENHSKRDCPEYVARMSEPYQKAGGMAALYEGVLLGGGDLLFGLPQLNLWLRRHRYAAFQMDVLLPAAHLCLEYAVRQRLVKERPGVAAMAERAAQELLRSDPLRLRSSPRGWLHIYWMTEQFPGAATPESRQVLAYLSGFSEVLELFTRLVKDSAGCTDAKALVEQAVLLYKKVLTRYFAPDHSRDPLPIAELSAEDSWKGEPLSESEEIVEPDEAEPQLEYDRASAITADGFELSAEQLAHVPEYLAQNFGPSFQTEKAMQQIEQEVCVELHEQRKLLFTDGLPPTAFEGDSARAVSLRASRDGNRQMLDENADSARQGIRSIEQVFRNALSLRSDPEIYSADSGVLVNSALWKVGRCRDPHLFHKIIRQEPASLVVELMIDASGSQACRQAMVAMQSYMFAAALSRIAIAHRVMSYCTYGDYTILRRFRDYDDPPSADRRILEYRATANNRDGLALSAAGVELLKRPEEHKIIIVFSDGLPNDMVSGRLRSGAPQKYIGDAAIQDTCFQIRKLRRRGVQVIGIFLGDDHELENERLIYGPSFLRIRRAEDFGGSAGKRLSETLLLLE